MESKPLNSHIKTMKKTIVTLMAMAASVATAEITDGLQWAESFGDGYDKAASFTLNNAFYEEGGVGVAGGDHADSRIWTTNLSGGNFTNAFTFSFKMVDFDANNWTDALSFTLTEQPMVTLIASNCRRIARAI